MMFSLRRKNVLQINMRRINCPLQFIFGIYPTVLLYLSLAGLASAKGDVKEYCQYETFQAECGHNEVILMESAVYGRMKIGRCVTRSFGLLGCQADVLHLTHSYCSGKQKCSISIPNAEMAATEPCSELKCYLEASYSCLPAAMIDQSTCTAFHGYSSTSGSMYLSSSTSPDNPCGTTSTPWKIDAKPGQTVTLGVLDLTNGADLIDGVCETLGYINEGGVSTTEICAAGYGVETELYTSEKDNVEVKMLSESRRSREGLFFIKYTVNGCTDLEAPPHSVYKREGDIAHIACTETERTWKLTCVNNQWEGVIGMCTQPTSEPLAAVEEELEEEKKGLTSSIVVALVVAVMVLLSSIILTFGLVSLARRRERKRLEQIYIQSRGFNPKSCDTLQSRETLRSHDYQNTVRPFAVKVKQNPQPYPYRNIELPPTPDESRRNKITPEAESLVPQSEPGTAKQNTSDSDYGSDIVSSNVTMLAPNRLRSPDSVERIIAPDYDSEEDDNYELHEGKKYHILEREDEPQPSVRQLRPSNSFTNSIPRVAQASLPRSLPRGPPSSVSSHYAPVGAHLRPNSVYARYVPQPEVPRPQDNSSSQSDYQHLLNKPTPNQNGIDIQNSNDTSEA